MMRTLMLALGAAALTVPAATVVAPTKAEAQTYKHKKQKRYSYREWRGRDGRMYCRKSNGTTGLVVGAAAGALVGRAVDTHGERTTGTVLGAVAGALAGREIQRSQKRCR